MVTNIVNLSNNPQKLDPPFILFPQVYTLQQKQIIHIQVPASSQLHKTAGVVFDRSNDGDFRISQAHQVAEIYNRKRNFYTEGIIYPALRFQDFKPDLFPKIRNLIRSNNINHPWLPLTDAQLLEMAGLWRRDYGSGEEGYTLAAALLLGKDEVIQNKLPHYKIDALVRIHNMNRYDDREYIQTNLIDAYEQVMAFAAKHLPDTFYLEGDQRVSLRTKIFREITANLIVHREYMNAQPCTFIIYANRVETVNANNPHGNGLIDPDNFAPFPKNPAIAKFFKQLGRVDELGSGVLNVTRLIKEYAGIGTPQFIEGEVFKMIMPVPKINSEGLNEGLSEGLNNTVDDTVSDTVNDTVSDTVSDTVKMRLSSVLLHLLSNPGLRSNELAEVFKISEVSIRRDMQKIKKLVEFKGSPKTGGYFLTKYMSSKLQRK